MPGPLAFDPDGNAGTGQSRDGSNHQMGDDIPATGPATGASERNTMHHQEGNHGPDPISDCRDKAANHYRRNASHRSSKVKSR